MECRVKIQEQQFGLDRVYACGLTDARYDEVAVALGGHGEYVTELGDLSAAFQRSFSSGKPACINIRINGLTAQVLQMSEPVSIMVAGRLPLI